MKYYKYISLLSCLIFVTAMSCEDFLDVELNKSKISRENVFSDDITTVSAMTGVYVSLLSTTGFASGDKNSVTVLTGLSSDEILCIPDDDSAAPYNQFENNEILSDNVLVKNAWDNMYSIIFQVNSIIEGLGKSSSVTVATKNQLLGEAYLVRGFVYFYLVNLFGDVPLIVSTDYNINSVRPRIATSEVKEQIENDIYTAKDLLSESYPTNERIRPNKMVASALLARVLLFHEKYSDAIQESSLLINSSNYALLSDLSAVFLANSKESIWQLKPNIDTKNSNEGALFIQTGSPNVVRPFVLNASIYSGFETNDKRLAQWINSITTVGGVTYYYAFKYKLYRGPSSSVPTPLNEYSMIMRLAEQYLIRAEARANEGDLQGAIDDIDMLRLRAGLPTINETNPEVEFDELILLIEQERKAELFTEWGHRWLDIKRNQRVDEILTLTKENWQSTDALYPLPQNEFLKNTLLGDQNPGY